MQRDYGANATNNGITILGASCVTNLSYMVCVGGQNIYGNDISNVFYAPLTAYTNYSIQSWVPTTDYGAVSGSSGTGGEGMEWPSCVYSGGYVYCVGGDNNSGQVSKSFYAPFLSTGGVGAWTETTDYAGTTTKNGTGGTVASQLKCVAYDLYIYCLGDLSSKVYYAPLSSSGIGDWTETTDYAAATGTTGVTGLRVDDPSCVLNGTYVVCVGGDLGQNYTTTSAVFSAPLSTSGVGAWIETTDYGAKSGNSGKGGLPIYATACANGGPMGWWIVCIGGANSSYVLTDYVFSAQISATGMVGPWTNDTVGFGEVPLEKTHAKTSNPMAHRPAQVDTYNDDCLDWWGAGDIWSYFLFCVGELSNAVYGTPLSYVGEITTTLSASSATPGQNVTDSVTLTPEVLFVGGEIQYYVFDYSPDCGGAPLSLGNFIVPLFGSVPNSTSYTIPAKASGKFSFMAIFYGDDDEEPVQSACEILNITGNSYTPTLTTKLSATSASVGQSVTDASTLTGADPNGITGSIIYYYSLTECPGAGTNYSLKTTTAGGAQPSSSPFTIPTGASGTVYFWAKYTGDTNDASAQSSCEPLTIVPIVPVSTNLTTQLNTTSVYQGGEVHDTATLSTTASSVSGYITYVSFATTCPGSEESEIANVTVSAAGVQTSSATVTVSEAAGTTVYFQAHYSGDAYNKPSTSPCESLTVEETPPAYHPTITTVLSKTTTEAGTLIYDSAQLWGGSTNPAPTGTVTYTYYQNANCSGAGTTVGTPVTVGAQGNVPDSADFEIPSDASGTVCFMAHYSGDSQNAEADSEPELLSVTPIPGGGNSGNTGSEFHEGPFVGTTGEIEIIGLILAILMIAIVGIEVMRRKSRPPEPTSTTNSKDDKDEDDDETDTPPPPKTGLLPPEQLATEETAKPAPPEQGEPSGPSPPSNPTEQVM